MDVMTAFLHGRLEEEVYMTIPPGMKIPGGSEGKVLRVRGALYGLKQSSHVWAKMFTEFMLKVGFKQSILDTCIYTKGEGQSKIILGIYEDDHVIVSPNKKVIAEFNKELVVTPPNYPLPLEPNSP